jgi:alpha-amylase
MTEEESTKRISLALIVHNHQPVGNFGWVIQDVYEKAYEPLIGALERHPGVRLALHYTGPLLEWMSAERPESIERLRALSERGQVEILGGGMFEPILVSLPQRDRFSQLARMRDDIAERFGRQPIGAWLAERVWEPSLPFDLASAGYEYTVLDDNHLRGAFVAEDEMWGTYTTDDQGRMLTVFGTEKGLRYRIPWKPVEDLIDYLRENATEAGDRVGIMGDDGEKFGAWPGTDELCWTKEEWVDRCFAALEENSAWLSTVTPSQWMAEHAPIGRVYIPTSSYVEMSEWALPASEQPIFHELIESASEADAPEMRFLRGALWRNFQARYREINDLHKQMLRASDAVDAMPAGRDRVRALDHLQRGQSNDCYWHGWFGGIYIVHMRMATLAELIAAEDLALGPDEVVWGKADYDLDGIDELALGTPGQSVVVDVVDGGALSSWDLRPTRLALGSVLRRRPEPYHHQIIEAAHNEPIEGLADPGIAAHPPSEAEAKDLSKLIVYDDHERRSALLRVLDGGGSTVGDFEQGPWRLDQAERAWVAISRASDGLTARKEIGLGGGRSAGQLWLRVKLDNSRDEPFDGVLELEWNINLLGGGANPAACYRSGDQEWRHDSTGSVAAGAELAFGNSFEGVEIALNAQPAAPAEWFAVETVSNSESGFERVYQGSCLIQRWPVTLAVGESATFTTTLSVAQSRDRSAEEMSRD